MSKEEYAQLHYLLAKLKYEALESTTSQPISKDTYDSYMKLIDNINFIQGFTFIDGADK